MRSTWAANPQTPWRSTRTASPTSSVSDGGDDAGVAQLECGGAQAVDPEVGVLGAPGAGRLERGGRELA